MGIFEFVIVLVLIATVGEVIKARVGRPNAVTPPTQDTRHLEETVEHLSQRVLRLEEERDFYRALLEPGDVPPSSGPSTLPEPPADSADPPA